jgi:hypothetical protein
MGGRLFLIINKGIWAVKKCRHPVFNPHSIEGRDGHWPFAFLRKHGNIGNHQEIPMKNQKNSQKFRAVFAVVVFLTAAGMLLAGFNAGIKFNEEKWDFGRIKQGKSLVHVFKFENTGTSTLKIGRVTSSCGCTAALVSKESLKPGEKGELKVTFNTTGYEGEITKYIYIETNDPAAPRKQVAVSASIDVPPRPKIELNTYSMDLGLMLEGEALIAEAEIKNRGELELSVSLNHRDAEFFRKGKKISAPLKLASGKKETISIKIPANQRQGLIREYILLRSNDSNRPNLSLYISGYIVSKAQLKDLFGKYKDILNK